MWVCVRAYLNWGQHAQESEGKFDPRAIIIFLLHSSDPESARVLRSSRKERGKRRKGRRKKLSFPNNELLPPVGRTLCFRLCAKKGFSQQSRHGEKVRALCISACFKVCSRRCRFFSPAPTGSESSNVANSSDCFLTYLKDDLSGRCCGFVCWPLGVFNVSLVCATSQICMLEFVTCNYCIVVTILIVNTVYRFTNILVNRQLVCGFHSLIKKVWQKQTLLQWIFEPEAGDHADATRFKEDMRGWGKPEAHVCVNEVLRDFSYKNMKTSSLDRCRYYIYVINSVLFIF